MGRGIPYIYKNKLFWKNTQTGTGVVSEVTAHLLESVGNNIG